MGKALAPCVVVTRIDSAEPGSAYQPGQLAEGGVRAAMLVTPLAHSSASAR